MKNKKTLICLVSIVVCIVLTLCGCSDSQTSNSVNQGLSSSHREVVWANGYMSYEVIEGHQYFVTHIKSDGYGSKGITSITHAESCPCKNK